MTAQAGENIVYEQARGVGNRSALLLGTACAALFLGGIWVSLVAFLSGMLGLIIVVTLWSFHRYTTIVVTDTELSVGSDSKAVAELDAEFGVARADEVFSEDVMATLKLGNSPERAGGDIRVLGGGWGTGEPGLFTEAVCRDRTTGRFLVVLVTNIDSFIDAMTNVLGSVEAGHRSGVLVPAVEGVSTDAMILKILYVVILLGLMSSLVTLIV